MKFENTEVYNFMPALRGMRNPKESWVKSDTYECTYQVFSRYPTKEELLPKQIMGTIGNDLRLVAIGNNDLELAQKLILAGTEHSKFMRQIFVSVDIDAPLLWWKEMDQYRINVTTNSESTMHCLSKTPITLDCFERNQEVSNDNYFLNYINHLESLRKQYNESNDKEVWLSLIQQLPESWLQMRTTTMNYANIRNMVRQRDNHKLNLWSVNFIQWAKTLPYAEELIFIGGDK